MRPRADLRELSNRLATDIRRFEQEELPLTQASLDELRDLREAVKEQRLELKEVYAYLFHQLDQALETTEDKIARLQARLTDPPDGPEDSG